MIRRKFLKCAGGLLGVAMIPLGRVVAPRLPNPIQPSHHDKAFAALVSNQRLRQMVLKFVRRVNGFSRVEAVERVWAQVHWAHLTYPGYVDEARLKYWQNEPDSMAWMIRQYQEDLAAARGFERA